MSKLLRSLSLSDATFIVIGTIIGTGVFLKTTSMTLLLGSPTYVMLAWVVGGLLSLTGALTYAELGSMMPDAGGEYVYLKEGYGDLPAFLYGWMRFWIASPGSIAAYSVGAMTFMGGLVDLSGLSHPAYLSIALILVFSALNCLSVAFGGKIQSVMTLLKVVMILGLAFGVFFLTPATTVQLPFHATQSSESFAGWSAFGSAVLAALWAFDGWCNLPMVAGEIKNPQRNVPLSLIIGMLSILLIYALVNLAYFYALPLSEILSANSDQNPDALPVATKAAQTFLGNSGLTILSVALVFSALGAMNGSILTASRVAYAMARDGLFFKQLGEVHKKTHVPIVSILVQAGVASALALSGTFDQLTNYVVFASWIFYATVTSVIFVLRKKKPFLHREYKTPGYPFLPLVFILLGILLLINTIITNLKATSIGLSFILAGIPFYFAFRRRKNLTASRKTELSSGALGLLDVADKNI